MSDPRSKRTSHFDILKELHDSDATGKKSHPVTVRKKTPKDPANLTPRNTKDWYFKVMYAPGVPTNKLNRIENVSVAEREAIAQELFRLFIPNYPKTRIVEGSYNRIYVASEGVPNYQAVERMDANDVRQGLLDGRYRGLGHTAVMALFCNEIDFKLGNLILSNGRFVKIDGDWCFATLRENCAADDTNYRITADNIARLPYCDNYRA